MLVQQSESPLALMRPDPGNARGDARRRLQGFPRAAVPAAVLSDRLVELPDRAKQSRDLASFRKADAAAKPFDTQYYSADMHQGALAMPPLLQRALAD